LESAKCIGAAAVSQQVSTMLICAACLAVEVDEGMASGAIDSFVLHYGGIRTIHRDWSDDGSQWHTVAATGVPFIEHLQQHAYHDHDSPQEHVIGKNGHIP
jgi:hypothetical protein